MSQETTSQVRIGMPERKNWSDAQSEAAASVASGPRGALYGPFKPLLHSPGLMGPLQDTGAYLRYGSELPRRYFEYVVLLVAAHWDQPFEWAHHEPLARAAGVTDEDVRSARAGTQPASDDLVPLHDMVTELLRTGRVSSHRFAPVESLLSSSKLIDLLGTVGYYTSLALIMNVADAPVTAGPSGSTP